MSANGLVFAGGGVVLALIGALGLSRKPRPAPSPPKVSLIELAAASLDPNFEPLPPQPWERKLDRLLCWIAVAAGTIFGLIGLTL